MSFKDNFTRENILRRLWTVILVGIWLLFAAFEISVPFFIYRDPNQNNTMTGNNPNMIYLYMCPMFVIPAIGFLSILLGICTNIGGMILHYFAFALNSGAIAYYILYFKTLPGMDMQKDVLQFVVPSVAMGLVALMDLVLAFDQCRLLCISRSDSDKSGYQKLSASDKW